MIGLRILPPAAKYFKKLKDKKLKNLYKEAINVILQNPTIAKEKTGDLRGIRSYDIYYNRINYELAYFLEYVHKDDNNEVDVVVVIMAGTRENFYNELKRYLK